MKIAVLILRILLGLIFLFASVTYFFKLYPQPEMKGDIKIFNSALSFFIMPIVKVIELVCALCFLSNRFVALATVVIFPIIVNIVSFHAVLDRSALPIALALLFANLFLAYRYRDNYKALFAVN